MSWGIAAGVGACWGCFVVGMFARVRPPFMPYVWPSSILLMFTPGDEHPVGFSLMLIFTVALNAFLYAIVFLAAARLRAWARRTTRRTSNQSLQPTAGRSDE